MIGIYKITSPSGKVYIGQSTDIEKRWKTYFNYRAVHQKKLHNSLKKYGAENHTFTVVQECEEEQLNALERYWQEYYDVLGKNGLNLKLTSGDGFNAKLSKETIEKIRKAHKGKKLSDDHKKKLSIAFTGERNHFYGKTHTKETSKKISLSNKNRVHTEEARRKMSASQKGRKHSEETKNKISKANIGIKKTIEQVNKQRESLIAGGKVKGENNPMYGVRRFGELNPMYGKSHKEETKEKIRQKALGRGHSEDAKIKMSENRKGGLNARAKIVLNTETGIYYDCAKDVSVLLNKPHSTVRCWLNGSNRNPTSFIYV